MERYPAVSFLVKHGTLLAIVVGLVPVALATWAVTIGWAAGWILAGIGCGLLAGLLIKILAELTTIIADMLLPQ